MRKCVKVCIIGKYYLTSDTRIQQQIKVLRQHNIDTDILCLRNKKDPPVEKDGSVTVYHFLRKTRVLNFAYYILHTLVFWICSFYKLMTLSFLNSYRIIIIHTLPEYLIFIPFILKLAGSKVILDARDLTVDLLGSRLNIKNTSIISFVSKLIEKCCVRFANHIITASIGFKNKLIERGCSPDKITVMINSSDPDIFIPDTNRKFQRLDQRIKCIYHGTVSERFGLHVALEAIAEVKKVIPESEFHMYGMFDPSYRKKLEKMVVDMNLDSNIFFHSNMPLKVIYDIIREMDIGIVPYTNTEFMNIALSTKTFEYISAGLPVVSSRLNSITYYFDDESICYADPENVMDLANKIVMLCKNPSTREKLVINAYDKYKSINGKAMGEIYYSVINRYLDRKF